MRAVQARGRFCTLILCEKKKIAEHSFRQFWCSKKFQTQHARRVVDAREWSPPPASYEDGMSRASRSTFTLRKPLIPTL
jgi:hypothetical protein